MAQDISLLFGVLGEGSLSDESGKLIQSQLTQLMAELNKNPLKVKIGIDTDTGGKKSWSGQLQEKLNQLSQSGKFSVQISNLKLSAGAIYDFRKQLGDIVHTLGLSTGTELTISAKGIGDIKSELKDADRTIRATGSAAEEASGKISGLASQMSSLNEVSSDIKKSIDIVGDGSFVSDGKNRIEEISAQYEQWAQKIRDVASAKAAMPEESFAAIKAEGEAIRENINNLVREGEKKEDSVSSQKKRNAAIRSGISLLTQMQKAERDWTAAGNGKSQESYKWIQSNIGLLKSYQSQVENGTMSVEEFASKVDEMRISFNNSSAVIKENAENTKSWSDRLVGLSQKFSAWLGVSQIIMLAVRSVKQMVSATIELDDAMTQLEIVTRTTETAYSRYMETISKTATRIGSSITDLISSTTTYARLGYSLDESSALAEFTAMLQNVGDIDVADAQDALTAIVKAFGISVDEIESVMDKLVATGNGFPISVSQIAEGMNNASSALAAAGNTFDQSVALLTAANTTIQNAAKSSTGLRTIAARLRSTKTELDELGESMTEAEYEGLVAALTKYNVALTEANGDFRSTYNIVADIAEKWEDLNSTEQAALANAIAGVRQQSVFFSMVEQFQEASGAMDAMANSAGTLESSYATFMESTTAHINQFKAAFQSLANSTFSSDLLNGFIDAGTAVLGVIEKITSALGLLGTGSLALFGKGLYDFIKTAGGPKIEGFILIVPAYTLVATRNELAA